MAKTIVKETFIILLICVAIGVLLAVIFYNYMPTNKIIPSKVTAYSTPANIAEEIGDSSSETEFSQANKTYEITDSDLSLYKKTQSYNPGKADPFAEYSENNLNEVANTNSIDSNTDKNTTDNYYTAANVNGSTK